MTPFDTSRSLTRRVPIYDSPGVVEYHGPVNSTKLLISVYCCSIRRLIIPFALNGSYCRSRLKNEVYMYIWLYPSIDNIFPQLVISFALNGSYCRSRFKNELHVYLASLLLQYPSIDNFFRSKRVMLSLTLKERGIHVYLACLLWQYSSIHNFFRFKHLMRCI